MPGTVDHRRMGGWKDDGLATHNPTLSMTLSNVGDRPIVNPRVIVEGGPDWFDIRHIVGEFSKPGMTDEEKSFALWQWCRRHIYGGPTFEGPIWGDTRSMTRFMNAFGTGACGTYHTVMPVIGMEAGLRTFSGCFADCSHAVQHEWYDGQARYFDAHIPHDAGQPSGWYALKLNNKEIASVAEIMDDRYLIDRCGGGPGCFDYVLYFGPGCSFGEEPHERHDPHRMAWTLRPGERVEWQWTGDGGVWQRDPAETRKTGLHCPGSVNFAPRLVESAMQREAESTRNLRVEFVAGRSLLRVNDPSGPADVVYCLRSPFPMTRLSVACVDHSSSSDARVRLAYSFDGRTFTEPQQDPGARGARALDVPEDPRLREPQFTHAVWFRWTLEGKDASIDALAMGAGFQVFRPSLPSLFTGRNKIRFEGTFGAAEPGLSPAARESLRNFSFEEPGEPGQAPPGWTAFGTAGGAHEGTWYADAMPLEGRRIFGAAAHYEVKNGGIYQRVRRPGGQPVRASVFVTTPGDSTLSSGCRIGIDPTGGADPQSAAIVWSPFTRSGTWKRIDTGAVDVSKSRGLQPAGTPDQQDAFVTVFLEHRHALDGDRFNVTGFDACVIEPADLAAMPPAAEAKGAVDVAYTWREMPDLPVPQAPPTPVNPADGGKFGFNGTLRWEPALIDGGRTINGYEMYISPRADLAWPVMPNTHRMTNDGEPRFALVFPDVLRDGATYYWRVRGRSSDGVWGDWSRTWSFIASGPNAPTEPKTGYDGATGAATLSWNPPSGGSAVDHYEIYGSGEPGFSPLREAEQPTVDGKTLIRPATILGTTQARAFDLTRRPEMFFRVAAVDAAGNRSVVTPIVTLPAALLPAALPPAKVRQAFTFQTPARFSAGRYARSLREGIIIDKADHPKFAITDAPDADWLKIDAASGRLSGTPTRAGTFKVTLSMSGVPGDGSKRAYPLNVEE